MVGQEAASFNSFTFICLKGKKPNDIIHHAGYEEFGRCHTGDESEESIMITQVSKTILALKARVDVTRSQKQWYRWPYKKD